MDAIVSRTESLHGTLTIPPDKAITHRALLVAAIAEGRTTIHPWPEAEDCRRTLELIQTLGVSATFTKSDMLQVDGCPSGGWRAPGQALSCGESGTTFRLAAGLLAGQPLTTQLAAGPALSHRPMRRIVEPLSHMGARITSLAESTRGEELYPPLLIAGKRPLRAIRYEMPVASAQVKSAVLLAGLFAEGPTTVIERVGTRDHTERMLRYFGSEVAVEGREITVQPARLTSPGTLEIPGDVSSAAFFIVAACCVPGSHLTLSEVGLNPTRTALLDILRRMGAAIQITLREGLWEPRGTVMVEARPLRAIVLEAHEIPAVIDELPILMVAAACAQGTSQFRGVAELRVKETDRIQSMVNALTRLGARIRVVPPETVEIETSRLTGAVVDSAGDHRTAMSLAVAGLIAQGTTRVRDAGCVGKSFPGFFDYLTRITGSATVKTVDNAPEPC